MFPDGYGPLELAADPPAVVDPPLEHLPHLRLRHHVVEHPVEVVGLRQARVPLLIVCSCVKFSAHLYQTLQRWAKNVVLLKVE